MRTKTISAGNHPFTALTIVVVVAAIALAAYLIFTLVRPPLVQNQVASPMRHSVNPAVRNQRLLELNEGIQPMVTAVPIDRNRRLLELNEGYASVPTRNPRDRRLYELNR